MKSAAPGTAIYNIRRSNPATGQSAQRRGSHEADFQESFNVGSFAIGKETMKLAELFEALTQTYCGSIGAE
ncbi:hypothetical protein, partial [Pantoea agglomerans]|uniref:hypothetical protein n=1 Tax=Enterobacter agglomerans TaxID=549 RepID=UPI001A8EE6FF